MAFVGIDIGTTFIKGAILNADSLSIQHICRVPFPNPIPDLPPLYKEYNPQSVLSVIQKLLADLIPLADPCEGILLCSQMHGLVLTTQKGEPESTLTTWQDQRVLEPHPSGQGTYFSVLQGRLGPDAIRQLGNELRPGQPLGILFWLAEQNQLPGRDILPVSLPDFILSNLCSAIPATEVTHAASHGAFNFETMNWHREIFTELGLHALTWPRIHKQGDIVGELKFGTDIIPCFTPVGDYQCALAGALLAQDELSINISTGSQVSLLQPQSEKAAAFGNYQTRPFFDGRYLSTITHIPAGRSLNALVKLLSELAESQDHSLANPWPFIACQAAEVGRTTLHIDLAFFDSACGDHGAITNIKEAELTVGHLFHAAFENMAVNYYNCASTISPEQLWQRIVLSGGLAQVEILRDLISQKFLRPYRICPTQEDTLLGLLAMAMAFTKRMDSIKEAADHLHQAYNEHRVQWPTTEN